MADFSEAKILDVWNTAEIYTQETKHEWRKDYAGAWIKFDQYGKEGSYGWEIDHAKPESKGGGHELQNLVPLHWRNNRYKADNYPDFQTIVSSDGNKNIEKIQSWNYRQLPSHLLKAKLKLVWAQREDGGGT